MTAGTIDKKGLQIAAASVAMNAKPAMSVEEACGSHEAVLEPKLDGFRLIAHVAEGGVHLYTRTGNDKAAHIPHIAAELQAAFPADTWLDGEAIAMSVEEGHVHHWGGVQSALGGNPKAEADYAPISYSVFDLIAHGGYDARRLAFHQRRQLLEAIFEGQEFDAVVLTPQLPAVEEAHEALLAQGYEGSVVKWLDAPYRSGQRGKGQFKLKGTWTVDAIVMGAKPGKGSFEGLIGAVIFGQHDEDGKLIERGQCSGMDFPTRALITAHLDAMIEKRTVIEVAHMGAMPSGGLRHPQFKRFRTDKDAKEVTLHDA